MTQKIQLDGCNSYSTVGSNARESEHLLGIPTVNSITGNLNSKLYCLEGTVNPSDSYLKKCKDDNSKRAAIKKVFDTVLSLLCRLERVEVVKSKFAFERGKFNDRLHLHFLIQFKLSKAVSLIGLLQETVRAALSPMRRNDRGGQYIDQYIRYQSPPYTSQISEGDRVWIWETYVLKDQ